MTDVLARDLAAMHTVVHSAANGDEVAFARLVAEHHVSMVRVAFVICGDAETARDAAQSAWVIAWRRLRSLRDPSHVRAWLVAIAANEARQIVRKRRHVVIVDLSDEIARADGADADESLDLVDLQRVLRGLKAEDRGLLAMRFAAGLESAEIAEQLGMSSSGVRSRLARLLERLRNDLALDLDGDR